MEGFEMVTVVAEATDGETVWYHGESVPACEYDAQPGVRVSAQAAAAQGLTGNAPAGLPISFREERWTLRDWWT